MKDDLLLFFNEFHSNDVITKELGALFIALIHKKEGAISLRDFRPISLVGSHYKNLANHLRRVLPEIISDGQGAFADGRQILDSMLI